MDMPITGSAFESLFGSKRNKKSFGSLQGNPCKVQWVSAHMSPGPLSANSCILEEVLAWRGILTRDVLPPYRACQPVQVVITLWMESWPAWAQGQRFLGRTFGSQRSLN